MQELFYYKMRQIYTKCVGFFITKCEDFIMNATVMRQLQNATILLHNNYVYYKMCQYSP